MHVTMAAAAAFVLLQLLLISLSSTAQPGFHSLDCGGKAEQYNDRIGIKWSSDSSFISGGQTATLSVQNEQLQKQFRTLRYFPADKGKYCYTIPAEERMPYLVRASFLYGNFDKSLVYPKFELSLGDTHWSTIVISDASTMVVKESIIRISSREFSVCLSEATAGQPFISTLEIRMLSGSVYSTPYEKEFFLALSARINFGAENNESIRYPDDPLDRIWESDLARNDLVYTAPGTQRISTRKPIFVDVQEQPPAKVMQTAVVGESGNFNYRIDLEDSIQNGWAFGYFAEIENLAPNDTRRFTWEIGGWPVFTGAIIDLEKDARGKYRMSEFGFKSLSFPRFLYLGFLNYSDSSKGPIINALEIYKCIRIATGSQNDHGNQRRRTIIIVACALAVATLLILVVIGCCCLFARKKTPSYATTRFNLAEIKDATNKFERILGSGATATVYHGKLTDGRDIAVKLLNSYSSHVTKDFLNEIAILSRIHHRHLVSFIGYCQQAGKKMLIYEFMPNGTLKQHIRGGPDDVKITSWVQRLHLAENAAEGIKYLHTGCTPTIVHRDIKTDNILLDHNMTAKIADFGLLKRVVDGAQRSSNQATGTVPYMDPEYYKSGLLSDKSDVYSFGVVLLELISGEPPMPADNCRLTGHQNIMAWARSHLHSIQIGDMNAIIDGSLDMGYNAHSVQRIAELAIRSVEPQPAQRPSISQVLTEIQAAIRMEVQFEAPPNNEQLPMGGVNDNIVEEVPDYLNQLYNETLNLANRR